jgi:hypothetical protein
VRPEVFAVTTPTSLIANLEIVADADVKLAFTESDKDVFDAIAATLANKFVVPLVIRILLFASNDSSKCVSVPVTVELPVVIATLPARIV